MITRQELTRIKMLCELATNAPWHLDEECKIWYGNRCVGSVHPDHPINGEFVVAAREVIPMLVEEIERLQQHIEITRAMNLALYGNHFERWCDHVWSSFDGVLGCKKCGKIKE